MNLDVFLAFSDIRVRFTQVARYRSGMPLPCCTAADNSRSRAVLNEVSIPFAVRREVLTPP